MEIDSFYSNNKMLLNIKVNTSSKVESIKKISESTYEVRFKATREKGKANEKLIEILSNHFNVSRSTIKIIKGRTSTQKVVEFEKEDR